MLLAAGHLIGVFVQNIRDVQLSGHFPHPAVDLACGDLVDGKCQGNVFGDGQGIQQVKILKHKAQVFPTEPGNLLFIDFGHIGSIQIDMSRADRINGGNAVEQGGLTGTGCTHDPHKFPLLNGKADVLNRFCNILAVSVILLDMLQFQNLVHIVRPPSIIHSLIATPPFKKSQ